MLPQIHTTKEQVHFRDQSMGKQQGRKYICGKMQQKKNDSGKQLSNADYYDDRIKMTNRPETNVQN